MKAYCRICCRFVAIATTAIRRYTAAWADTRCGYVCRHHAIDGVTHEQELEREDTA